ncbi:MAG TPA: Rieske 2Fe-2S domain-containing protein [Thermoleophilaceae bacterium]|nr:Rieske 2Fe-2S domain-containing protein [Thermoleophilaceae bacterium]
MRVTSVGHAGLFVETRHGSVLCDPWFNAAYFESWFPFPSNREIDPERIGNPTYLYVSHLHHDHFDPRFLHEHVSKEATVLLPDYPLPLMERALRDLGFTRFVRTRDLEPVELDGLTVTITAAVAPTDGPLGDSGLILDDGETRIFDQNDSRPLDLDALKALGPYDAHFLQFSGAIWYPMVYRFPEKRKEMLGRQKRENQLKRAFRYAEQIGADFVFPSAGPPCFLDDDLFAFNDFDRDPANIFPDQTVFLEYLAEHGRPGGRSLIPGSTATLADRTCTVEHPLPEEELHAIFADKRAYLEAYRKREQPAIQAAKASWPRGEVDIAASLREWFEPLLEQADMTCVGVNGRLLLDCGQQATVIDFQRRRVYPWRGEEWEYRLGVDPALVESCILNRYEDWINQLFLSCRFEAERKGPFNEYVYNFFKTLTEERIQYAEGYYAEQFQEQQMWQCGDFLVQRRCPHLKADLTRFGVVEDGILTCTLHGWQFELATGRCLTSDDRRLHCEPLRGEGATAAASRSPEAAAGAEARRDLAAPASSSG